LVTTELLNNAQVLPKKFVALMVADPFWTVVAAEADNGPEAGA